MLSKVTAIIPLAFLTCACAEGATAPDNADAQNAMDTIVDKIFSQALRTWPSYQRDFDNTVFARAREFTIPTAALATGTKRATPSTRPMVRNSPSFRGAVLSRSKGHLAQRDERDALPALEVVANARAVLADHRHRIGSEEEAQEQQLDWPSRREAILGAAAYAVAAAFWALPQSANAATAAAPPAKPVAPATPTGVPLKTVEYKTFRMLAPAAYQELPEAGQTLPGIFLLLVNGEQGLTGNTVALIKQPVSNIDTSKFGESKVPDPKTIEDLGSIEEVSNKVVGAENGDVQAAVVRKDSSGQLFYQIDYKRKILGLQRRVLMSLAISEGVFYALLLDLSEDSIGTPEGDALQQTATSLVIKPQPTPAPTAKPAGAKPAGAKPAGAKPAKL